MSENTKLQELLKLRRLMKARQPKFSQQCSYKRKRVNPAWRKPKGLHAKMRKRIHGKSAIVSKGYIGPKAVRGLDKSGLKAVLVHTTKELELLDPKQHGVLLASVGMKTKQALLQACKEKGLSVLNTKTIDGELSKIAEKLASAKAAKEAKVKKKATLKPVAKPLVEKVETENAKKEVEKEKRELQKKEMEKVLIKRE